MHKCIIALALALAILTQPALAGSSRLTLLESAAQTASGNGASIPVAGISELAVFVRVTAGSGTLTAFSVWIEGSSDAGKRDR